VGDDVSGELERDISLAATLAGEYAGNDTFDAVRRVIALAREAEGLRERNAEAGMCAHRWMVAHDRLKAGQPYDLPAIADLPDATARALKAEAERDAALRECGKWATEAGFARGKLETSELAGVVDDWKARAIKAEAERDAAREALERIAKPEYGIGFNRLRGIARTYLARPQGDQP